MDKNGLHVPVFLRVNFQSCCVLYDSRLRLCIYIHVACQESSKPYLAENFHRKTENVDKFPVMLRFVRFPASLMYLYTRRLPGIFKALSDSKFPPQNREYG